MPKIQLIHPSELTRNCRLFQEFKNFVTDSGLPWSNGREFTFRNYYPSSRKIVDTQKMKRNATKRSVEIHFMSVFKHEIFRRPTIFLY